MSGIKLRQVNNHEVEAIPLPNANKRVRGAELCSEVYANIFLVAKKKSGKTSALFYLIKHCAGKDTKLIIFCTTLYRDSNWIAIRKWLDKKGIEYEGHTSLYENGQDHISELIDELNEEGKETEETDSTTQDEEKNDIDAMFEKIKQRGLVGYMDEEQVEKKKKTKLLEPERIIIFDDIGNQLKSPSLLKLLTWNRHYKAKCIISSQWVNHMLPESRKQLDLWLLFKGQPEKKLEEIYRDADLSIPFEEFLTIYKKATKPKFSFLYLDTRNDDYRRNFNQRIILPNSDNEEET